MQINIEKHQSQHVTLSLDHSEAIQQHLSFLPQPKFLLTYLSSIMILGRFVQNFKYMY